MICLPNQNKVFLVLIQKNQTQVSKHNLQCTALDINPCFFSSKVKNVKPFFLQNDVILFESNLKKKP